MTIRHAFAISVREQVAAAGLACLAMSMLAHAAVDLGALPDGEQGHGEGCRFHALSERGDRGSLLLQWDGTDAVMRVDGSTVALSVAEEDCAADCVAPGTDGVRLFRFVGEAVSATLRKNVSCSRDAEECGGLPAGSATLSVTADGGSVSVDVTNDFCDL